MTEKRQPWGKWYWADWRADVPLRMCGFAARGLWADMLSLMAEAAHFGLLLVKGLPPSTRQLAGLLGGSHKEIEQLLGELGEAGVYSRIGDPEEAATAVPTDVAAMLPEGLPNGIIISRRMIRDKAKAEKNRTNGGLGGNPKLKPKPPKREEVDNGEDIRGVNQGVKAQIPDTRSQIPEEDLFERFWGVYPRLIGKGQARKSWKTAAAKASPETIIAAAQAFADQRSNQDPKFTPHPATWLNGERWADQELALAPASRSNGSAPAADDDWKEPERRRLKSQILDFREGKWREMSGPQPGTPGCLWPDWLQREELDRLRGKAA